MLTIVIFGASGDLAKKKTFPALFALFKDKYLPEHFKIYGYARTSLTAEQFHSRIGPHLKKKNDSKDDTALVDTFLHDHCEYISGEYDSIEDYESLCVHINDKETTAISNSNHPFDNVRLFYLALPPSVFIPVAHMIKKVLYDSERDIRLIIEKPFGKDLNSSNELSNELAQLFSETELYRIDHYLGKEMVKSIMTLRFANIFFNAIWNRQYISNVQIVFKETMGVEGRGGYFDDFGIIRDVMQNHILQILTVIAMERPATSDAEDVRNEKVKVLRCIPPLSLNDVLLGQYTRSKDGAIQGYLEDETIPDASNTPTFAMTTLKIENERWAGVPFILRCGKGLNEHKAEIRIQFCDVPGSIFPSLVRNELVIRVQPNESVYMKMMVKRPGLDSSPIVSDLDLSYANRYIDLRIPEAYEALLLDALRGDRSNFVRSDELEYAWRIFTPLLHEIDKKRIQPIGYPFGSRGPVEADQQLEKLGYIRYTKNEYSWPKQQL